MRLNHSILSNLRESDSSKLDDLYSNILNCQEMYIESSDDGDVFAGTEDSYVMEMLEQHLFDAIAYSGFFRDDTDPRIMPVYNKIMDLITSNVSISKKDVEDAIKVMDIKESTNSDAKILDDELTGGGVISFVGEVGNYNFLGDLFGSIEFFDKKFGIDSWEKYTNIEDDAWDGKYGDNIRSTYDFEILNATFLPEYIPDIGRALKKYAKTIKNYIYREQFERFGDELLNFKNTEEDLKESAKVNLDESINEPTKKYYLFGKEIDPEEGKKIEQESTINYLVLVTNKDSGKTHLDSRYKTKKAAIKRSKDIGEQLKHSCDVRIEVVYVGKGADGYPEDFHSIYLDKDGIIEESLTPEEEKELNDLYLDNSELEEKIKNPKTKGYERTEAEQDIRENNKRIRR